MNCEGAGNNSTGSFAHTFFAGFEGGLKLLRMRIDQGDIEGALEALLELEKKYVRGAVLYDLLGDVLLARGDIRQGVRYKTLYQILKGTFTIVAKEAAQDAITPRREPGAELDASELQVPRMGPPTPGEPDAVGIGDFVPITASMAQEFMRQGHYERAASIFAELSNKNPNDESLSRQRELALQKMKEKRLLQVFRRWLTNIEQIKSVEPTRS
jgi:tetratricopeptide (TPR) repeat protein